MAQSSAEIKQILINENDDFRQLHNRHQNFEKRLDQLYGRPYLTMDEEREVAEVKKRKLNLKDQMHLIIERYKAGQH